LPQYYPTPCLQSAAPNASGDELQMCEYELSNVIDAPPSRSPATEYQWLSTHAVEARSTGVAREERPLQHRATSTVRTPKYKREDRASQDPQAGSSTVSGSSISNGTRASDPGQSNPGSCIVSPIPSLCRARARALTIASTSRFLRLEQTELRRDGRVQNAYDDTPSVDASDENGGRSFRSQESPFTRRVKEKLREAHAHNEELPRKPSQQTAELHALAGECKRELETPGTKFESLSPVRVFTVAGFHNLEPLLHEQEQLKAMDSSTQPAPCADGEVNLRRTHPLNLRSNKPKLLMGPRKHKLPPAPGSVMDRVMILEGRDPVR
jgi:hypothetical protein